MEAHGTPRTSSRWTYSEFARLPSEGSPRRALHSMPEVSRFQGIAIAMYYQEHGVPHFHASYGEHEVSVEVESRAVHGTFPPRALRHVLEWAELHQDELLEN